MVRYFVSSVLYKGSVMVHDGHDDAIRIMFMDPDGPV